MRVWLLKMSAAKSSVIIPSFGSRLWRGGLGGRQRAHPPFCTSKVWSHWFWICNLRHFIIPSYLEVGGRGWRSSVGRGGSTSTAIDLRPWSQSNTEGGWGEDEGGFEGDSILCLRCYHHTRKTNTTNTATTTTTTTTTTLEFLTRDWIFFRCARLVRRTGGRQNKRVWRRWRVLGEGGWWWLQPPVKQKNRHGNQAPSPSAEGTRSTRGRGWRPGLAGVPAGLILNFKEVPAGGKDTCSRWGGWLLAEKIHYRLIFHDFDDFHFSIFFSKSSGS